MGKAKKRNWGWVRIHSIDLESKKPKNTNYGSAGGKIVSEALRRRSHASARAREYATHTSLIAFWHEKGKKGRKGAVQSANDDPMERPRSCVFSSPRVQWTRDRREKVRVLREGSEWTLLPVCDPRGKEIWSLRILLYIAE